MMPRLPFPQHVSYAYPDVKTPTNFSQGEKDGHVCTVYQNWKRAYIVDEGGGLFRVALGKLGTSSHAGTVSEGQGYGMIITALMAGHDPEAQLLFDGLWRFSRDHLSRVQIGGRPSNLMAWKVPSNLDDQDSAFDGDCDIAYSLILADKQWGSGGVISYLSEARKLLADILLKTVGPDSHLPLLGDWVDPINGTPTLGGQRADQYTPRSSDLMPAHFRTFERTTGNVKWDRVIWTSQNLISRIQTTASPATGLVPDFVVITDHAQQTLKPAPYRFLEEDTDGDYAYNACRLPWRIVTDALLNNDATSLAQARKISAWAETKAGAYGLPDGNSPNPEKISECYKLDGTPLHPSWGFSKLFAAPLAVAAMTISSQQDWLNKVYAKIVEAGEEDYYEDTVTLLCMLVLTGNYWNPLTA